MATIENADEQIWVEDINDQEEMSLDSFKVTQNFFHRLRLAGADPRIVSTMAEASEHFLKAHQLLGSIRVYFPPANAERVD